MMLSGTDASGARDCIAVIDIGTNTSMTLAMCARADGLEIDAELVQTTRLGQGVGVDGELSLLARERALAALRTQRDYLHSHYAHGIALCVATSAVRDAANATGFMHACAALLGRAPMVLSGVEEARLTFRGAVSDLPVGIGVIEADIGGGSTEVSAGLTGEPCGFATSVDVGCVRLAETFSLHERVSTPDIELVRMQVRELLTPSLQALAKQALLETAHVVCTGGSATTYAALIQELLVYDRGQVHGFVGDVETLRRTIHRLFGMSSAERAQLPGIPAARAAVLPAGLLILDELLSGLGVSEFRVSIRGLRYGLALALARGEWAATWSW